MTKFYVDVNGKYLGGFGGGLIPDGGIEVNASPSHATDRWDGTKYIPDLSVRKMYVQQKLRERFEQELPYGQLISMVMILDKQGQAPLTGQDAIEQARQRVTFGKITALAAHAKQLESNLDVDVNADIESGW